MQVLSEPLNDQAIRQVLQSHGFDTAKRLLAEYRCIREGSDGRDQELQVRIYDCATANPNLRYWWDVRASGPIETGPLHADPAATVTVAGHNVQWRLLDADGWGRA